MRIAPPSKAPLRILTVALAAGFACLAAGAAHAESLTFRSGLEYPPRSAATYLENAYCGGLKPGADLKNRECVAVRRWISANGARPKTAWTPPPFLD